MKVWVDGQLDPTVGFGKLFKDGKTMSFTGNNVRRGVLGVVRASPTSP